MPEKFISSFFFPKVFSLDIEILVYSSVLLDTIKDFVPLFSHFHDFGSHI